MRKYDVVVSKLGLRGKQIMKPHLDGSYTLNRSSSLRVNLFACAVEVGGGSDTNIEAPESYDISRLGLGESRLIVADFTLASLFLVRVTRTT